MIGALFTRAWARLVNLLAPILVPILLGLLLFFAGGWAWQTVRIEGFHLWLIKVDGLRKERDDAIAALAAVKKAQPEAAQAQAIVNHAPAAAAAQIAEKSNVDAQAYYERGRAAGAAYADAHRVLPTCPGSPVSNADLPGADHAAPVNDRSSAASLDVAVSRADYDILVGNSLRLAKVYQDAQALIDAGVAVASSNP
ncbi:MULTISPECIES: hypothetical protein [unclassified Novosphingobium]|uniref:hypothetical protein n=1 Tax=unclassified Novosphingobium TaxID=2644732 RepID=UPI000D30F083|nr:MULTISPECIES: hypothetical protein [unclassified Novosphingobium]PTR07536.1 hypothetical protein C8K11_1158 [Novosphingobium sp. GV055]PUB00238.1 hypothetical protein C8K12_1158 [Novosphingobium sp. GV061]PUB15279.1 hypothetical protein C8K14_1158 [Novosphingobium sp. GV079]PUB39155.1 hypothetical protein C8K10_1158 [Novosphingobium sp. GV027]